MGLYHGIPFTKKMTGGLAQGIGSEFKLQYWKKNCMLIMETVWKHSVPLSFYLMS
jgi:hypothetical protein